MIPAGWRRRRYWKSCALRQRRRKLSIPRCTKIPADEAAEATTAGKTLIEKLEKPEKP